MTLSVDKKQQFVAAVAIDIDQVVPIELPAGQQI